MDKKEIKKIQLKEQIKSDLASTLNERVERYLEIDHQPFIGGHYFSEPSTECLYLYRDGYYIGTVMMSQSINEALIRFITKRNNIPLHFTNTNKLIGFFLKFLRKRTTKNIFDLIKELKGKGIISPNLAQASKEICKSHRNDVHHMNSVVDKIDFKPLAKKNMDRLTVIEKEIFETKLGANGGINPLQPKYWDFNPDGTMTVYLRLE